MKLSEAIRIIDDTVGMFRTFLEIMEMGQLWDEFLKYPVKTSTEHWVDLENTDAGIECKQYYTYIADDGEHKNYVVDIHPVCNYMIDEWPSPTSRKIRKLLKQDFQICLDYCKEIFREDYFEMNWAFEDTYNYQTKYGSSQTPSTIVDVIFDTIHTMYHALGVVQELDEDDVSEPHDTAKKEAASKQALTSPEEELCHFIHPRLDDEGQRMAHEEIKNLVAHHQLKDIVSYLKGMAKEKRILLPQNADNAYKELVRMGMPDKGKGFSIKTFYREYSSK